MKKAEKHKLRGQGTTQKVKLKYKIIIIKRPKDGGGRARQSGGRRIRVR